MGGLVLGWGMALKFGLPMELGGLGTRQTLEDYWANLVGDWKEESLVG